MLRLSKDEGRMKLLIQTIFTFCLLFLTNVYALTLSEIRTEIRRQMRDNITSRQRYSDAFLNDYINESQRAIVNATWLSDRTTEYILTPNTSYYDLPVDLLTVTQIYFKNTRGQTIKLEATSQRRLYDKNPDWERQKSTPFEYWISNATSPVATAGSTSTLKISYIPIPNSQSTGTVTIWYINNVADLSEDDDVAFENRRHLYPYHILLSYHATARLKLLERKLDESTAYFNLYTAGLAEMKKRLGEMPDYTPSMSVGTK